MRLAKYKKHSEQVLNFMRNHNGALSRVEILNKFKTIKKVEIEINNEKIIYEYDRVGLTEKALKYLLEKNKIIKFHAKSGRVMYKWEK